MLKWLKLKIIFRCQKLVVKLRYFVFLAFFNSFAHKVAQTWYVLQETWPKTIFGTLFWVEVVRIENRSHMLEITCYVAFLCVFKLF